MISKYWRSYLVLIIHNQSGAWIRIPSSGSFNQQRFRIWVQFRLQKVSVSSSWCFSPGWNTPNTHPCLLCSALLGWDMRCDNGISYEWVLQRTCTEKHPHRLRRLCDRTHYSAEKEIDRSATIDHIHSVWALLTSDLDPIWTMCLLGMKYSSAARALYRH